MPETKYNDEFRNSLSSVRSTEMSFYKPEGETSFSDVNLTRQHTGHLTRESVSESRLRPVTDIEFMTACMDGLVATLDTMKEELTLLRGMVQKYGADYDSQRLNCKTKELEVILLRNENARLQEELDKLKGVSPTRTSESFVDFASSPGSSLLSQSLTGLPFDAVSRSSSRTSGLLPACRYTQQPLTPITKPRIFRRANVAAVVRRPDSSLSNSLFDGKDSHVTARSYETRESNSCIFTNVDNTNITAESSVSGQSVNTNSSE